MTLTAQEFLDRFGEDRLLVNGSVDHYASEWTVALLFEAIDDHISQILQERIRIEIETSIQEDMRTAMEGISMPDDLMNECEPFTGEEWDDDLRGT